MAALRTMTACQDADPEVIRPLAASKDKRTRGAAIAALAKHSDSDRLYWLERGLKDPAACVRMQTATVLAEVDPSECRAIFELALHDPNPEVERRARELTVGKGYARPTW
ncbi:MAG: HEAT repeat domain-containing protein [Phycisphaerae bacterium]|nr:HEAT repeat domain-containing protein [Phycisphaerae bacterium]